MIFMNEMTAAGHEQDEGMTSPVTVFGSNPLVQPLIWLRVMPSGYPG